MNAPAISRLRELFRYEGESGELIRKIACGACRAGSVVGFCNSSGYRRTKVDGTSLLTHRIVWAMHCGVWPTHDLDHIDRNRANNRISNLREITRSGNTQNRVLADADSISGALGVSRNHFNWQARIRLNGKLVYLGTYATIPEAEHAYLEAKKRLHPWACL